MNILEGILGAVGQSGDLGELTKFLGNGGLEGLTQQLQSGGLGEVVQSWISNGENLPVSVEQLSSALSPEMLQSLTSLVGGGNIADLAQNLPELVNKLTPNGSLENIDIGGILGSVTQGGGGDLGGMVKNILGGLFK